MAAGYQISASAINNRSGQLAAELLAGFDNVAKYKAWLDAFSVVDLETQFQLPQADGTIIKSAVAEMGALGEVWRGAANLTTARDFRVFPVKLVGLGQY